jgi:hypothetical protein
MTSPLSIRDQAAALYRAGHSSTCVAGQIGRTREVTRYLLELAGVTFRPSGTRCRPAHEQYRPAATEHPRGPYLRGAERLELAAALKPKYEAGASVAELAVETGRSPGTVTGLLRLAGTRMRPAGRPSKSTSH